MRCTRIRYHAKEFPPIQPGPWVLGGLIPTFVGIAQIIIALISGATIAPCYEELARPVPPLVHVNPRIG
jgi:hypothetical protein